MPASDPGVSPHRKPLPRVGWFLSLPVVAYREDTGTALVRAPLTLRKGALGVATGSRWMAMEDVETLVRPWTAPLIPEAGCRLTDVGEDGIGLLMPIRISDPSARRAIRNRRVTRMVFRGTGVLAKSFDPNQPRDERGRWSLADSLASAGLSLSPEQAQALHDSLSSLLDGPSGSNSVALTQVAQLAPPMSMPIGIPMPGMPKPPLTPEQLHGLAQGIRDFFNPIVETLGHVISNTREELRDILAPGGKMIGRESKSDKRIREAPGGAPGAEKLKDRLLEGGDPYQKSYPGEAVQHPGGEFTGYRPISESEDPAIDVNIPGLEMDKIHFPDSMKDDPYDW